MTFTLAHLSDVHLGPIHGLGVAHVNLKRALGLANWFLKRRHIHLPEVTGKLVDDLHRVGPNHIAVTGDLVNLGLPGELEHASRWLQALGPPDGVTLVPGNHDIYVRLHRDQGVERWRAYMQGDGPSEAGGFPFVRRLGPLALIGLNSALPRPPFYASGRLGERQLQALARVLDETGAEGRVRVVMIHHPPLPGQADVRRGLEDAAALAATFERHGAELVLHGHNHMDMLERRPAKRGETIVVGIASASTGRDYKSEPLGRYNLYSFEPSGGTFRLDLRARGLARPGCEVVEFERRHLGTIERPAPVPLER